MKLCVNGDKTDAAKNRTLRERLLEEGVYIDAPCGGRGHCGKCRVRFLSGAPSPLPAERQKLSEAELEAGFRLSCCCIPKQDCEIELPQMPDEMEAETEFDMAAQSAPQMARGNWEPDARGVAVDLGTTTIAMTLVRLSDGERIRTQRLVNHQRIYGADVISRIQSAVDGRAKLLKNLVRRDLSLGMERLLDGEDGTVQRIAVAGNTTMCHLLMGYSCETLGVAPFTPVTTKRQEFRIKKDWGEQQICILPGVSAYIGGDIVAGILALGMDECEEVSVLLDIGTNSEMVVGNKDGFLAASAAAGPAFEGNSIANGMSGVAGAISHVVLNEAGGVISMTTIGDEPPKGICGSGIIDVMGELVRNGIADENGTLKDPWFDTGIVLSKAPYKVCVTQADVREIQMAKAAIRAGLALLLKEYGVGAGQIRTVYLAGGFGRKLDVAAAVRIGLIPAELAGKVKAVGNAALEGACLALSDDTEVWAAGRAAKRAEFVRTHTKELCLAGKPEFEECYLEAMGFEHTPILAAGESKKLW